MQLTSSPRRAFGLLAVGTVGMSTALLSVTAVAHAAAEPHAPVIEAIAENDGSLLVFFSANDAADGVTPDADYWEYSLDGGTNVTQPDEVAPMNGYDAAFTIDGLTNGDEYTVVVRGVDEGLDPGDPTDDVLGAWSDPKSGTPYLGIGAPGTPTVQVGNGTLTITWTAPTTGGTYDLAGYEFGAYVDTGDNGGHTELCATDAATLTCTAPAVPGWKYTVLGNAVDTEDNWGDESGAAAQVTIPALTVPSTVPTKHADLTLPAGTSSTVAAGTTVTVSGSGYLPGSTVTLAIYSTPQVLTTVVADADGNFTATVTVPAGLAAGEHTLVAAGIDPSGNLRYVNLLITVTAGGTASVTETLANTGADVTVPAVVGIATLGLGAGLIVVSRRRRAAA